MTAQPALVHTIEGVLFLTLAQLILIIVAARAMHVAARRIGQPGAVGEIVAGLMLGPSLLGHLLPYLSATPFDTAPLPLAS